MNNAFQTELYKLRKSKMALIGFCCVTAIPLLLLLKTIFIDKMNISQREWVLTASVLINVVFPVMSCLFITQSIQKEYTEKTIINMITAPTPRIIVIISKLAVWFCWYVITLFFYELLTCICSYFLFPSEIDVASIKFIIQLLTQNNMLSFVASMPILWISIKCQTIFYPSILVGFFFTVLQLAGSQVSESLLPLASCIPWTAIPISTMLPADSKYFYVCIVSILCCGIFGIVFAWIEFKKQDL